MCALFMMFSFSNAKKRQLAIFEYFYQMIRFQFKFSIKFDDNRTKFSQLNTIDEFFSRRKLNDDLNEILTRIFLS